MKRSELQNNLAMTIILVAGAMLFLTLFMGYAIYRTSSESWIPSGVTPVSLWLPTVSTLLILASSWFCYQLRLAAAVGDWRETRSHWRLTFWLGMGFLASQTALWAQLKNQGIYVSSGIFASVMYGFT